VARLVHIAAGLLALVILGGGCTAIPINIPDPAHDPDGGSRGPTLDSSSGSDTAKSGGLDGGPESQTPGPVPPSPGCGDGLNCFCGDGGLPDGWILEAGPCEAGPTEAGPCEAGPCEAGPDEAGLLDGLLADGVAPTG
jgi:hypothetical protein